MLKENSLKIVVACLFIFILSFSFINVVSANDGDDDFFHNVDDDNYMDDMDDDELDDDNDFDDDYSDEDVDEGPSYYEWEWKGNIYYIDLEFNLTDEELTELFTKRDALIEEIEDLELKIGEMELSRNQDILAAVDDLYYAINNITNNTEFNDLLLSLKDIHISEVNSTFNDLKTLLESIKLEYPDEDFTEIDFLMDTLETLLNEELERYENLNLELNEKLDELFELFEKYPFLTQYTKYSPDVSNTGFAGVGAVYGHDSKEDNISAVEMKNSGMPYFSLAILMLILGLFGFDKRKF